MDSVIRSSNNRGQNVNSQRSEIAEIEPFCWKSVCYYFSLLLLFLQHFVI